MPWYKIAFRVASALLGTKSPKLVIFQAVCVFHGLDFAKNCMIFKENLKKMHIFRKKMHFFLIFCGKNLHKWKFCINFAVENRISLFYFLSYGKVRLQIVDV